MGVQQCFLGIVYSVPLSVTAFPSTVDLFRDDVGVLGQSVAVSATGGVGGYTYSSSLVAGGTGISLGSATSSTYTVSASGIPPQERSNTVLTVVTDSLGNTGSVSVPINMVWGV